MRAVSILVLMAIMITAIAFAGNKVEMNIPELEGDWEGTGTITIPMTGIEMDIEGEANFKYFEKEKYLRTSLIAEKFMFAYSDSGHLVHDEKTDVVTWEVWDNRGKHAFYKGKKDGNVVRGDRKRGKDIYSVEIKMVAADTIVFRLTATDPEGNSSDKARFNLWRVTH